MKRHILCFGDSNTHGYCVDAAGLPGRLGEDRRWTCLLQTALGSDYLVIEEGLSGRTTVFDDPLHEGLAGIDYLTPCLMSHEPVDLLVIMLGTNDVKERFSAGAANIARGMERLVRRAQNVDCWGGRTPNILIVAPPAIGVGMESSLAAADMGAGCISKSRALPPLLRATAELTGAHFFDANPCPFNEVDFMHLTTGGHAMLSAALAELIPTLL